MSAGRKLPALCVQGRPGRGLPTVEPATTLAGRFAEDFQVTTGDPDAARTALSPELMRWLLHMPWQPLNFRFLGSDVICWADAHVFGQWGQGALDQLSRTVDLLESNKR
ncbi:hypothetical protein [Fodinicola feengrottensis]|uniref:hypothetical protein n=1 Tax=Fodinicola feengrottensis TaxID=435914 RepID=UPI002442129C|nr:hypothetical protein [Fodinicola feengrottensis]